MDITKEESGVLLRDIFYCKNNGFDNDYIEKYIIRRIKKLSKLRQDAVIGSYAIVRWYDNNNEDVVCTTKEVAEDYVKKYNALSGKEKCFVDTEIWLPLKEA